MRRLLAILLFIAPAAFAQSTVNWTDVQQTIDGIGAGQNFSQNYTPSSPVSISLNSSQLDLIYSNSAGNVGYSWVRTGNWPDNTIHDLSILQGVIARGAKIALSLQSPPVALKASGTWNTGAYGVDGNTCFAGVNQAAVTANIATWGNDIVTILQQYNSAGVPVSVLSMLTESNSTGGVDTFGQCDTTAAGMTTIIKAVVPIIKAGTGYPQPLIAMPETSGWFSPDYATNCLNDATCASEVDTIFSHNYSGNDPAWGPGGGSTVFCCHAPNTGPVAVQNFINSNPNHKLWMSETSTSIAFDPSIGDAMTWTHQLWGYLTIANVNYWQYWAMEWSSNFGYWLDNGTVTKRFYAIGNFAKFIRPGWVRIGATSNPAPGIFITAAKEVATGKFAIVAINCAGTTGYSTACTGTAGPISQTFTLSNFPAITGTITPTITDATRNLVAQTDLSGVTTSFTYSLPQQSVTTFTGTLAGSSGSPCGGLLASARCIDWSKAGIPGVAVNGKTALPDFAWPNCTTAQAGTTMPIPATASAATINAALTACPGGTVTTLAAGTFTLASAISFPTTSKHVLRGASTTSTKLAFQSGSAGSCNSAHVGVCGSGGSNTYRGAPNSGETIHNVTAGLSQGSTVITLDAVTGITANNTVLIMTQCDTGVSGADCKTGTATENGGYYECASRYAAGPPIIGCSDEGPDGQSWRFNAGSSGQAWLVEQFFVTAVNGNNVTLNRAIHSPSWSTSQNPTVIVRTPVTQQNGVENLSIDASADGSGNNGNCLAMATMYQGWISQVSCTSGGRNGFWFTQDMNSVIMNSYIYGTYTLTGDSNAVDIHDGSFNLIINNIFTGYGGGVFFDGPEDSTVVAYNYTGGLRNNGKLGSCGFLHSAGDNFILFEGNFCSGSKFENDTAHAAGLNTVLFRNLSTGYVSWVNQGGTQPNSGEGGMAYSTPFGGRYDANIANVLGTTGYSTSLNCPGNQFSAHCIYVLGASSNTGSAPPVDPLSYCTATGTSMCWANYDVVTGAARFNSSEVPTGAPTYPNPVPTACLSGGGCTASLFVSSKPAFFGSSQFPGIGYDVSSGNIGQCSGTLGTTSQAGMPVPISSPSKCSTGVVNTAWSSHVTAIPSAACFYASGGIPDGTNAPINFNPDACYSNPNPPTNAANPVCVPGSGTYPTPPLVSCSTTSPGAIMCYTINGITPSVGGAASCPAGTTQYSSSISVPTGTLRIVAGGTAYFDSSVVSYNYIVAPPGTVAPVPQMFSFMQGQPVHFGQ